MAWSTCYSLVAAALVAQSTQPLKHATRRLGPLRAAAVADTEVLVDDANFRRPSVDKRQYRLLRLGNGLEVALVSDADADEAGAALSVKAGSFDDTLLGLAHFHEHMLFLGTEKYPAEDEYEKYLSSNGGGCNAYTADDTTCYYFNVNADQLDGALDRLAQFFVAPTLEKDAVEREVKAVDSEYRMALQDDGWRLHSVLKATAVQDHPFARFSTGSEDTLLKEAGGIDGLHAELKEWNRANYVSANMRLAVVGRESLEVLEALVTAPGRFGAVPSGTMPVKALGPAWTSKETSQRVRVAPVRDLRSLQLLFPMPPRAQLRTGSGDVKPNPEVLVSHLLGHEGRDTLHSKLRDLGWVDSLVCGSAVANDGGQLFELAVDLTDAGDAHCEEVLDLLWSWIGVIQRASAHELETANQELADLGTVRFDFSEKGGAADTASNLADALWEHPRSPIAGPALVGPYDPQATQVVLDALKPENCVVFDVRSSHTELVSTEKWHGAAYDGTALMEETVARWSLQQTSPSSLKLPLPNKFASKASPLVKEGRGVVRLANTPEATTLWKRSDYARAPPSVPRVPKTAGIALFRFKEPSTAIELARDRAFCGALMSSLNHDLYDAQLAGLSFTVEAARRGLEVRVSGFDARSYEAFELIADRLTEALSKDDCGFEDAESGQRAFLSDAEDMARRCADSIRDDPLRLAGGWARRLIDGDADLVDVDSVGAASASFTNTDVGVAASDLKERLTSAHLEIYVAGNVDDAWALKFAQRARTIASPKDAASPEPDQALRLPAGDTVIELRALAEDSERKQTLFAGDKDAPAAGEGDPNCAVQMVFQVGRAGDDEDAASMGWSSANTRDGAATLLGRIASTSAFDRLRTKEQLGYMVDAGLDVVSGAVALQCGVQSATGLDPKGIEARIEAWTLALKEEIADMSQEDIARQARGLSQELLQRPGALRDVISRDWHEVSTGRRRFSHVEFRAESLLAVTREDLLKLVDDHLLSSQRRVLRTRVYAAGDDREGGCDDASWTVLRTRAALRAFKEAAVYWPPAVRWDEGAVGSPAD